MSLKSWKKEFYKRPADRTSKKFALQHSIRKWTGLLKKNLRKHNVSLEYKLLIDDNDSSLCINSRTCALCEHFLRPYSCPDCPISWEECRSKYSTFRIKGSALPMLNLLKAALRTGKEIK